MRTAILATRPVRRIIVGLRPMQRRNTSRRQQMVTTNRRRFLAFAGVSALGVPLLAACSRDEDLPFSDEEGGAGGVAVIQRASTPE